MTSAFRKRLRRGLTVWGRPFRALAGALALWLGMAASLAPGQPAIEPEGYFFPAGSWSLEDWNADGALDMSLFSEGEGVRVWLARPGERARFRLRPDFEVQPPVDCSFLGRLASSDQGAAGGSSGPSLAAIDPQGVLAWEPGGDWKRVWSGPTLFQPVAGEGMGRHPLLTDGAFLPDFDGDGARDLILVEASGRWRIVWGPLRPDVGEAPSTALQDSQSRRQTRLESRGAPSGTLYGYGGVAGWNSSAGGSGVFRLPGAPGARLAFESTTRLFEAKTEAKPASLLDEPDAPVRDWPESAEWRPGAVPKLWDIWTRRLVWRQTEPRVFRVEPRPTIFDAPPASATPQPLASASRFAQEDALAAMLSELSRRLPEGDSDVSRFADIDGDGTLDAFYAFGSGDPLRPRANVRVYLGLPGGGAPDFQKPASSLRTRALLLWPKLTDVDGDGDLDAALFFPSASYASPSEQLKAYLQLGVPGTFRLYLWDKAAGGYAEARSFAIELQLKHEVFGLRLPGLGDVRLEADHDGDGASDLGFPTSADAYTVWRFDPKKGFGASPMFQIQTPGRLGPISPRDVDGDGRDDLIIRTWDDARQELQGIRVYLMRPAKKR